jgi:hypothetical protein
MRRKSSSFALQLKASFILRAEMQLPNSSNQSSSNKRKKFFLEKKLCRILINYCHWRDFLFVDLIFSKELFFVVIIKMHKTFSCLGKRQFKLLNFQLLNFHAKCCFKIETFWNKKHKKTFEFVCVTLMCWTTICFLECVIRFIVKHIRVLTWLEFYYQHKLLFVCFALVWFSSFLICCSIGWL